MVTCWKWLRVEELPTLLQMVSSKSSASTANSCQLLCEVQMFKLKVQMVSVNNFIQSKHVIKKDFLLQILFTYWTIQTWKTIICHLLSQTLVKCI